jgi:ribose 5-phosphate isomerase A
MANTPPVTEKDKLKRLLGSKAADIIEDDMLVGLGTGSTAKYFIDGLINRAQSGLKIHCVATSTRSEEQAIEGGLKVLNLNDIDHIDITVDGADEIDAHKNLTKGGGGALFREKLVASLSRELIIIADESKSVDRLGRFPLPVELVPFGHKQTMKALAEMGYEGTLRLSSEKTPYLTDNSNYIFDIQFKQLRDNPLEDHKQIRSIIGVLETGFFIGMAGRVLIAKYDGTIEER